MSSLKNSKSKEKLTYRTKTFKNSNKNNSTSNSSNTLVDSSTDDDDEECDSQWAKVN